MYSYPNRKRFIRLWGVNVITISLSVIMKDLCQVSTLRLCTVWLCTQSAQAGCLQLIEKRRGHRSRTKHKGRSLQYAKRAKSFPLLGTRNGSCWSKKAPRPTVTVAQLSLWWAIGFSGMYLHRSPLTLRHKCKSQSQSNFGAAQFSVGPRPK